VRLSGRCIAAFTSLVTLTRASGAGTGVVFVPRDDVFGRVFATRTVLEPRLQSSWDTPPEIAVTTPMLKRSVKPAYSREAMAAVAEGKVLLEVLLDEGGVVVETNVLAGAHPTLNTPAIHAIPRWRFVPALENGRAVPLRVTVQMEFSLRNKPR
jgi:TonB family protein